MGTFLVEFAMKGILRSQEKNIISLFLHDLLFDVKFVGLGEKMPHKKNILPFKNKSKKFCTE